jgi:putative endonuclease
MGPGSRLRLARDDSVWALTQNGSMGGAHIYFVYMLASGHYGTLYVGVSNDIIARTWEHKNDRAIGFTRKYAVHRLVWFEQHQDIREAIAREKRIKRWLRDWKIGLIEEANPHWADLYPGLIKAGWTAQRPSV